MMAHDIMVCDMTGGNTGRMVAHKTGLDIMDCEMAEAGTARRPAVSRRQLGRSCKAMSCDGRTYDGM